MKSLALITATICIFTVSAKASLDDVKKSLLEKAKARAMSSHEQFANDATPIPPSGTPTPPATPLRQAKVRVRVDKNTTTHQPDGGFQTVTETVCSKSTTEDVFDLRNQAIGTVSTSEIASCPSTVAGKSVTVHVSGVTVLAHDKLFDAPEDVKFSSSFMYVDKGPAADVDFLSGGGGTTDLNSHSIVMALFPVTGIVLCSPGSTTSPCPSTSESFSSYVEVQD